ncbi:MAG: TMEM175 family protein [Bacteroidota bacterium]
MKNLKDGLIYFLRNTKVLDMIRDYIRPVAGLDHFRQRGQGGSRLEALSDGVFALAIAMLLISTSVPQNFDELWLFVKDLVPFSICSIFIYWIWGEHALFFHRFNLTNDKRVITLSFTLIMLVPFYVYALKFLMSWLVSCFTGFMTSILTAATLEQTVGPLMSLVSATEMPKLMIIYAVGFIGVFGLFMLLYRYTLKNSEVLELNEYEVVETQFSYCQHRGMVITGLISLFFAVVGLFVTFPWMSFISGSAYNLMWILAITNSRWRTKALAALH